MGNIIQIKRATGVLPSDTVLQPGEMAYVYTAEADVPGALYIGDRTTSVPPINIFQSNVACRLVDGDVYELFDMATGNTVYPQIVGSGAVEPVPIENGGTGASNIYDARDNLKLLEPTFGNMIIGTIVQGTNVSTTGQVGKFDFYKVGDQARIRIMEVDS